MNVRLTDTTMARVYVKNSGMVVVHHFESDADAYRLWLGLGKGVLTAFRGAGDVTPVYSHDFVDTM